jgi:hypothetical protein
VSKGITLETRLRPETIAGLLLYYTKRGTPIRTRSELVRRGCTDFLSVLENSDLVKPVTSKDEAIRIMAEHGFLPGRNEVRDLGALLKGVTPKALDKLEEQSMALVDGEELEAALKAHGSEVEGGEISG